MKIDNQTYKDLVSWLILEKAKAHDKVRKDKTGKARIRNHAFMLTDALDWVRAQKEVQDLSD